MEGRREKGKDKRWKGIGRREKIGRDVYGECFFVLLTSGFVLLKDKKNNCRIIIENYEREEHRFPARTSGTNR